MHMEIFRKIIQEFPYTFFTVIITAVISVFGKKVIEFSRFIIRKLKGEGKKLEGNWNLYLYCNSQEDYIFNESVLTFKLSFSLKLKYNAESMSSYMYSIKDSTKNKNVFNKYRGYLEYEDAYLNLLLHSENKNYWDTTFHKFNYSNINEEHIFCGVYASTDYNFKPCCGISILSRNKLSKEDVNELIKVNYSRLNYLIFMK